MCSVDHKGEPFYLYRTQFESKVDEQTPPWHLFVDIDAPLVVSAALMLGVFSDRCPPPTPEDPRPVMQKFNAIVDKFPWEFRPRAVAAHHQEAFRAHWALERELHESAAAAEDALARAESAGQARAGELQAARDALAAAESRAPAAETDRESRAAAAEADRAARDAQWAGEPKPG